MASRISRAGGIGTFAPPLDLPAVDGERRTLADLTDKPTLISFLGPAHCLFCRAHVIRLIQARDEIDSMGANVVFVTYHDPEMMTAKMLHDLDVPYTLLLDPSREAYLRYGLGPQGWQSMVFPALYFKMMPIMLDVMRKREKTLGTAPGAHQLGGDFVVNCVKRLAFVNRMRSLHDRAKTPDLLAALRACAGAAP